MKSIPGQKKPCKECGLNFKVVHRRTQFCSKECSLSFHTRLGNGRLMERKQYKLRKCLGVYCNGRKYFKSLGAWQRICAKCKAAPEYGHVLETYKFDGSAKR